MAAAEGQEAVGRRESRFYRQTVAWCVESRCMGESRPALERFWRMCVLSRPTTLETSLAATLFASGGEPTRPLEAGAAPDYVGIVTDDMYGPAHARVVAAEATEAAHGRFAIVVFASGLVVPVGVSLLRLAPWPAPWARAVNAYLVQPPLAGTRHATPLWGLGLVPTRAQALMVAYLWLVSVLASVLGLRASSGPPQQPLAVAARRQGVLAFALLPLAVLYAGRNAVLLWLTDWSRSTFLLLHRWAAFLCVLHAIVHSLCYVRLAAVGVDYYRAAMNRSPAFIWGSVATLAMSVTVLLSAHLLRARLYELFRLSHVALSAAALVGCFMHIGFNHATRHGYHMWIYLAVSFWCFEYAMRLLRILLGGLTRRAYVTPIDDVYYRLDVPDVHSTGHFYLYFPTAGLWRIWESHPFAAMTGNRSAVTRGDLERQLETRTGGSGPRSHSGLDAQASVVFQSPSKSSLIFFIRRRHGMTSLIPEIAARRGSLPVLLEGHYSSRAKLLQRDAVRATKQFPHLVCVAGGVGISGVLPALCSFSAGDAKAGSRKLYWAVKTMPLVQAVERTIMDQGLVIMEQGDGATARRQWDDVEVNMAVGSRPDIGQILRQELCSKTVSGGVTVVVCGPSGMTDDARCAVAELGRHSSAERVRRVRLIIEDFSW